MVTLGPAFAALLVALVLVAATAAAAGRLGVERGVVTASVRGVVQLAVVSLVIAAMLRSWWGTGAFVALMLVVAAGTAAGRLGPLRRNASAVAPIAGAVLPIGAAILASGAVPASPVAVLPIAGILIGGAMTATSLAGRRALDELRARRGEHEAALALGLLPRDAALEVCRASAAQGMVPGLDQTRTVGLVTLPGAFVGVLLGGGSAVDAGATQVLVLLALLAVQAVAVTATVELVARGRLAGPPPEPRAEPPGRRRTAAG